MPNCDKNGRAYLELSKVRQGLIELDDGFTCASAGKTMLFADKGGFFFFCADGKHYLDGQTSDDGQYCVGVYSAEEVS